VAAGGIGFRKRRHGRPDQLETSDVRLSEVVAQAHDAVRTGLGLPPQHSLTPSDDDHDTGDAYDAEVATVSGYLGVAEAVLYPAARRRVPGGRTAATAQRRRARRIERLMHLIEGRFYGDSYAAGMNVEELQDELTRWVEAYAASELDLARRLDAVLSPGQRRALIGRFLAALAHAPTRPHPFAPHPRGFARIVLRVCGVWDRAMDVMDNRVVPGQRSAERSRPLSRWDRYFLGTVQFDDSPGAGKATAGTPDPPTDLR
jgi:hypothetical protein